MRSRPARSSGVRGLPREVDARGRRAAEEVGCERRRGESRGRSSPRGRWRTGPRRGVCRPSRGTTGWASLEGARPGARIRGGARRAGHPRRRRTDRDAPRVPRVETCVWRARGSPASPPAFKFDDERQRPRCVRERGAERAEYTTAHRLVFSSTRPRRRAAFASCPTHPRYRFALNCPHVRSNSAANTLASRSSLSTITFSWFPSTACRVQLKLPLRSVSPSITAYL